jgi:hypothetical protein
MLLTVGSIPRSTDDTLHQFQQTFPEPVGTLGGAVAWSRLGSIARDWCNVTYKQVM